MSNQLELLFRRCDNRGTGFINQGEFRDLCHEFEIDTSDADIIFDDLDHDGDGRISFEDFSFGFRDFVTPGSRRGSIQLGLTPPSPDRRSAGGAGKGEMGQDPEREAKQKGMERRHMQAKEAWKSFADHLGKEDVRKVLSVSSDKIFGLYEELQTSEAPPHLLSQYEEVISALVSDVKKMETETKKMEAKMAKERESHSAHLKEIEAELDSQVAKLESAAREKARRDYEAEKRQLQEKMDAEMTQLQSQLKIFQKIDSYLNKEKDETLSKEAQKKLETAISENRLLKGNLSHTQTNIALLRAEFNQMRSQYESKCFELNEERENKIEFVYEFDNLNRQLDLLRDANVKLMDTNDGLRSVVDVGSLNSPRVSGRHEFSNLISSPDILRSASDLELSEKLARPYSKMRRNTDTAFANGSRTPSDNGGSVYDSDSMRSRCSDRPKVTEAHFGAKRLLDDFDDSGHSSLPALDRNCSTPDDEEAREAIQTLEAAVASGGGNPLPQPRGKEDKDRGVERDREVSEVSEGRQEEELEDEVEDRLKGIRVTDPALQQPPVAAPRKASADSLTRPSSSSRKASSASNSAQVGPMANYRDLEPTGPPDRTYKVVFAGDAAVGKTSFINRLTKGVFLSNLSSTLGVDFQVKTIRVDERNIAIQLWDTAGQERFRSVTRSYFRRADGVMLLYDVTSDRSFLSVRQWIEAVDDVSEKRIPIMLCANKVDLRAEAAANGRRCISTEEGEKMSREHSAIFVETSAKDGKNVMDALVQLSRDMCSSEDVEVQTSALKIRDEDNKKRNCCKK